jgi:hypothetical protein
LSIFNTLLLTLTFLSDELGDPTLTLVYPSTRPSIPNTNTIPDSWLDYPVAAAAWDYA